MKKHILFIFMMAIISIVSLGQTKTYTTKKLDKSSIRIDGIIDDADWENVSWQGNFTQQEPNEGAKPSQKTEFKILYDENNLYVAIKAYDTDNKKIEKRMARRDNWDGDLVAIQIDSYNDKKTAFIFAVSASGVRSDAIAVNDNIDNADDTWDPLWTTKTAILKDGWSAEMKIPFSQLRFNSNKNQKWGLEVVRFFFRNKEWDMWQHIPQDVSGWVSHFGELQGIKDLKPKRQIEISPYVSSNLSFYEKEEGNPYAMGKILLLMQDLMEKLA